MLSKPGGIPPKQIDKPMPTDFALNNIYFVWQIGLPYNMQIEQRTVVDFVRMLETEAMAPAEYQRRE